MSAGPSVTATISAEDLASPKVRQLMKTLKEAERLAGQAFNGDGVGRKYAAGINQATVAAERHVGVLHQIHAAHKAIAATVAGYAGLKLAHGGIEAISHYLPYGREMTRMQAITGYGKSDMAALERQQAQVAQKWGLTVEDTLKAQEEFAARGYNAAITRAATGQSIVASRALGLTAQETAKMMEGITFGRGVTLTSAAQTESEMRHSADMAAVANKKGAMSGEDITQFAKYAMGLTTAANIAPETAFGAAMTLKKNNVSGDEAGTFMRAMAGRLLSPTRPAYDALAHMGLRYEDYSTQGPVTVDAINRAALRRYGKGIGRRGQAELQKRIDDGTAMESRENFAKAINESLQKSGEKLSRTDMKHVVAAALKQYDMSRSALQGDRLFRDIVARATPQELSSLIGDKQGGRAAMLLNNRAAFLHAIDEQQHGAGFAEAVAIKRQQDLAAAVDRLKASFDALEMSMVRANEVWLTPMINAATKVATEFNSLSDGTKQAIGVMAGVTTIVAGGGLLYALSSLVMSAGAASAALQTLAASAGGSAAANAAAPAVGAAAKAGKLARVGRGLAKVGQLAGPLAPAFIAYGLINENHDALWPSEGTYESSLDAAKAAYDQKKRLRRYGIWGPPSSAPALKGIDPYSLPFGYDWNDIARVQLGKPAAGDAKWGGSAASSATEVKGTVTGEAELHSNMQVEVKPSQYFEGIVKRAESVATMALNGLLGTSMQGPGDNGAKPATPSALTGTK